MMGINQTCFFLKKKTERHGTTAAVRQMRCFEAVLFAGAMVGCMYVMGILRAGIEVTDMHGPWERDYA